MNDGILVVNKPSGMTSFDCVAILRKKLGIKKMGHTGTLDKMVSGVLVICVNRATKLVDILVDHKKTYEAKIKLGFITDTLDSYGKIEDEKEVKNHTIEEIDNVLQSFKGEYNQIPPIYSSIKKDGKKLYEYALKNIDISLEPRKLYVYDIKRTSDYISNEFSFTVESSKGLYVRALARDIAYKLDELGIMSYLKRTKLGDYSLNDAKDLNDIEISDIIPLEEILDKFPKVEVKDYLVNLVKNGITLDSRQTNINSVFAVTNNNTILALYKPVDNVYKPVVIL